MTICETLTKLLRENFDARLEKFHAAHRGGNADEASRSLGFIRAYAEGLQAIEAFQNSDSAFITIGNALFNDFRVRVNNPKWVPEDASPAFCGGLFSGYTHVALLIEEQVRKHTSTPEKSK